jgi:hypothetical protein
MTRLHLALALGLAAVIALSCSHTGPSDTQAAIDSAASLREAQGDAKRQSQFMATVRRHCGSDNAAWEEMAGGGIQCRNKRGRVTTNVGAQQLAGGAQ